LISRPSCAVNKPVRLGCPSLPSPFAPVRLAPSRPLRGPFARGPAGPLSARHFSHQDTVTPRTRCNRCFLPLTRDLTLLARGPDRQVALRSGPACAVPTAQGPVRQVALRSGPACAVPTAQGPVRSGAQHPSSPRPQSGSKKPLFTMSKIRPQACRPRPMPVSFRDGPAARRSLPASWWS